MRKLQKELKDYAPPALTSRYLEKLSADRAEEGLGPWWQHNDEQEEVVTEMKALTRVRTHAEDLAELTTPKVSYAYFPGNCAWLKRA